MKRVRQFIVNVGVGAKPSTVTSAAIAATQTERLDSWHRSCELIAERLNADPKLQAEVFSPRSRRVIARFTAQNLSELESSLRDFDVEDASSIGRTVWQSVRFSLSDDTTIFENRNTRDFHWDLLEGAQREVPFALSTTEILAQRYSLAGYMLSLVQQWKDLFARPL